VLKWGDLMAREIEMAGEKKCWLNVIVPQSRSHSWLVVLPLHGRAMNVATSHCRAGHHSTEHCPIWPGLHEFSDSFVLQQRLASHQNIID